MCLRKQTAGYPKLYAINFCVDDTPVCDKHKIFIPDMDMPEQVVSFAIPKAYLPYDDIEHISFSVIGENRAEHNKYSYTGKEICCDLDGYLVDVSIGR